MKQFQIIDDFIEADAIKLLQEHFQKNIRWTYGWQSDPGQIPFSHWNHDFIKSKPNNQINAEGLLFDNELVGPIGDLWINLKKSILTEHALVRCYANAHTHGVEGYIHYDSRLPGNYTTICYLNPQWRPDWGGETIFVNELGEIAHAVLPKPGRLVVFDGRILHAARGLSRICPAMRATLMFKTVEKGATIDCQ
jgi:hypothetical protein